MATFTNQATLTYNNVSVLSNITSGQFTESLSVTKTAANGTYAVGDRITYAVTLANSGTAPLSGVTLADDLGAFAFGEQTLYPLTYVAGSLMLFVNGTPAAAPEPQGVQPLEMTGLNVPANGNLLLIYEAEVNAFAPPEAGAEITNTVTATETDGDTVTASATVTADTDPVLSVEKTLEPLTVQENGAVTYTLTVYNSGGTEAGAEGNPVITDTFDPPLTDIGVTYNGAAWTGGVQYTYTAGTGAFVTADGAITVPAATFERDPDTGAVTVTPGKAVIVITGSLS